MLALDHIMENYIHILEGSIQDGDVSAMVNYANYYYSHPDLLTDELIPKVISYFEKGVEEGFPLAGLNLGSMYFFGDYVKKDLKKAILYYEKALDSYENSEDDLYSKICYSLGNLYYITEKKNLKKAYNYFFMGYFHDNDSSCIMRLGDMYMNGDFVQKNENIGFQFYESLLDEISLFDKPELYFRLGKCFYEGIGCEKNILRAYKLFMNAEYYSYEKKSQGMPIVEEKLSEIRKYVNLTKQDIEKEV